MVMFAAEVVRARRCLAGDAAASNKFWPGTLEREFEVSQGGLVRALERGK